MRSTLKIRLFRGCPSDLICIVCGGFRCDAAVVVPGAEEKASTAGIHKGCLPKPKPRRPASSCVDCGARGVTTGHQECQYPGRFSDPDARHA